LPGSTVARLHDAIAPAPLSAKGKIHSGLDRYPVSSGINVYWRPYGNAKGAAIRRICHRKALFDQRTRQAVCVGVKTHIETLGRTSAVKVHTVDVYRFNRPGLAASDDEIVGQFIAKSAELRLKIL
jgi:hypothetical protein